MTRPHCAGIDRPPALQKRLLATFGALALDGRLGWRRTQATWSRPRDPLAGFPVARSDAPTVAPRRLKRCAVARARTPGEPVLPKLLSNSVARSGTGEDEEVCCPGNAGQSTTL
jgi:hypothetical protein